MEFISPSVMAVQIAAIVLFFFIGTAITYILITYIKSKPPLFITLIDLINMDMLALENLNKGLYCVIHIVITTGYRNEFLATFLSFLLTFHGMIFLDYLSFGAVIQYILVKWKTTHLFENLDDQHLIRFVRLVMHMIAGFTLMCLGFLIGPEQAYILQARMMGKEPDGLVVGVAIMIGLSALGLIVNLYSRLLLHKERKRAARTLRLEEGLSIYYNGNLLPYVTKIFFSICLSLLFKILLPTHLVGMVNLAVYVGFTNLLFIAADVKMGKFFCKTLLSWFESPKLLC